MLKPLPDHRDNLGAWLNESGLTGEGAEIGVAYGAFSAAILATWKGKLLHMIDPWVRQDPDVYREKTNNETPFCAWKDHADSVAALSGRGLLHQGFSVIVAQSIPDASLDFAYIDGNHSQEAVFADLKAWWPKVKDGGLIGGHDFLTKTDEGWFCEVDQAVMEWTALHSLPFKVTPCSSFWVRKL